MMDRGDTRRALPSPSSLSPVPSCAPPSSPPEPPPRLRPFPSHVSEHPTQHQQVSQAPSASHSAPSPLLHPRGHRRCGQCQRTKPHRRRDGAAVASALFGAGAMRRAIVLGIVFLLKHFRASFQQPMKRRGTFERFCCACPHQHQSMESSEGVERGSIGPVQS